MTQPVWDANNNVSQLQDRRSIILVCAAEVFADKGYHSASMEDIAARAGISKPLVYQHFSSKRDLYLGLLDLSVEMVACGIESAVADQTDNKQRLIAAIRYYFEAVANADRDFRLIFESDFTQDPDVQSRVNELISRLARNLGRDISHETGLGVEVANLVAAGLGGMAQAAAFRWIRLGKQISMEDAIENVANLAWLGLSSLPSDAASK